MSDRTHRLVARIDPCGTAVESRRILSPPRSRGLLHPDNGRGSRHRRAGESRDIEAIGARCTMLVACMDRGFSAAHHWVNETGLSRNIPAMYSDLSGDEAVIGPLVVPGRTGCFMCYRMRRWACEPDSYAAMSFDKHLDGLKCPALHQRALLPMLPSMAGNLLGLEILKFFLLPDVPNLAGRIHEFDALGPKLECHAFMERSDCPACGGKIERRHYSYRQLVADYEFRGNLQSIASELVSARTGLVDSCEPILEEDADPGWPHVYAARLSNHRFVQQHDDRVATTTGKGLSAEDAFLTALGETIERYTASGLESRGNPVRAPRRAGLYLRSTRATLFFMRPNSTATFRLRPTRKMPCSAGLPATRWYATRQSSCRLLGCSSTIERAVLTSICAERRPAVSRQDLRSSRLYSPPPSEVIERDAYMIAWFNRLAGQAVKVLTTRTSGIVYLARLLQRARRRAEVVPPAHRPAVPRLSCARSRQWRKWSCRRGRPGRGS